MLPASLVFAVGTALIAQATPAPQIPSSAAAAQQDRGTRMALPEGAALHEAVASRSEEYFTLFFDGCNPEKLRSMLHPNFEFYHDRNGITRPAERFVTNYANRCRNRLSPRARRSRRELVPGTLRVFPVPGFGAIEEGHHRFFPREGDGPEGKPSFGRYLQFWSLGPDGWRLSRVFSYDHRRAE